MSNTRRFVVVLVIGLSTCTEAAGAPDNTRYCNAAQNRVGFIRYPLGTIGAWSGPSGEMADVMTRTPVVSLPELRRSQGAKRRLAGLGHRRPFAAQHPVPGRQALRCDGHGDHRVAARVSLPGDVSRGRRKEIPGLSLRQGRRRQLGASGPMDRAERDPR
jgi:hypothetical protein